MMLDSELNRSLGLELLPAFSLMFAQIAACCASAGAAIMQDAGFAKACHDSSRTSLAGVFGDAKGVRHGFKRMQGGRLLFEPSWALIEFEVAGALYKGLKTFWHRVQHESGKDFINPTPEVLITPSLLE